MAYFVRKNRAVYIYHSVNGKPKALPRKDTKHLDLYSDEQVKAWLQNWERTHGYEAKVKDELTVESVKARVTSYLDFLRAEGKAPGTINWYRQMLNVHVLPFLVNRNPPVTDPNQWPPLAPQLLAHYRSKNLSQDTILKCNVAMRKFWTWLQEEQVVITHQPLVLRKIKYKEKETRLKHPFTPAEVLKFLERCTDHHMRLIAIMGYFFSLRPQEIFALQKKWFRAGSGASEFEACKIMASYGLYNKLAYDVQEQRTPQFTLSAPKAGSKGLVACFDEKAAKLLVEELKAITKTEAYIFGKHRNRHWYSLWAANGLPNCDVKDLRRSSLYWLGHHAGGSGMQPIPLKNHARHLKMDTTMKYVRRPGEGYVASGELDLDS